MPSSPTLQSLLSRGSTAWNERRGAGGAPKEHTGATIEELICARADLSGLGLVGTEWSDCELDSCDFRGSDLSNAWFHGGKLKNCDFREANLEGATFEGMRMKRCDFSAARGLDSLELEDVDMRDVVGLEEEDDEDLADEPKCLRDVLPRGYRRLPLGELLEVIAQHAQVEHGRGADEDEVRAFEAAIGAELPADYRAFVTRFGQLQIITDRRYNTGELQIFGVPDFAEARHRFREHFDAESFPDGWLDAAVDREPVPDAEKLRVWLRDSLRLDDLHIPQIFDDHRDAMRVAYQHLMPVIAMPDEMIRHADCVGPGGQMYTVSVEARIVEPPEGTFTSRLVEKLGAVIVGEP